MILSYGDLKMRVQFDRQLAIATAFAAIFARKKAAREKDAAQQRYGYADLFDVTATEVEREVRDYAYATLQGKPWGTCHCYGGVRMSGNLMSDCRDWLLLQVRQGKLEAHNYGRGHISGMRFRPKGEPMSPQAVKTIETKVERRANPKPRLRHFIAEGDRLMCQKRRPWRSRWRTNVADDPEKVTCPRCLKAMHSQEGAVAVQQRLNRRRQESAPE